MPKSKAKDRAKGAPKKPIKPTFVYLTDNYPITAVTVQDRCLTQYRYKDTAIDNIEKRDKNAPRVVSIPLYDQRHALCHSMEDVLAETYLRHHHQELSSNTASDLENTLLTYLQVSGDPLYSAQKAANITSSYRIFEQLRDAGTLKDTYTVADVGDYRGTPAPTVTQHTNCLNENAKPCDFNYLNNAWEPSGFFATASNTAAAFIAATIALPILFFSCRKSRKVATKIKCHEDEKRISHRPSTV
jgi:hypothetical protein